MMEISSTIAAPFFFVDLASSLGSDTLAEILGTNRFMNVKPTPSLAVIATVGLARSLTSNLIQAISGIVYCNAKNAMAQFTLLTAGGETISLIATWNGRTNVNVEFGAA